MSDNEYDYIVMPFVVTTEMGGPLDPKAYACGWEMGALSARLSAARHHGLGCPEVVIHRENVPQASLVAMQHGMTMEEKQMDLTECANADDVRAEWAHVVFDWGDGAVTRDPHQAGLVAWIVIGLMIFIVLSYAWERARAGRKKQWWER